MGDFRPAFKPMAPTTVVPIKDKFPAKRTGKKVRGKNAKPAVDGASLSVEASEAFDEDSLDSASQTVLHEFDLDAKFGPAMGISRSERWERAEKLNLDPPEAVKEILETLSGDTAKAKGYEKCIWEGRV